MADNEKTDAVNIYFRPPNEEIRTAPSKKAAQKKLNRKRKRKFNRKNQVGKNKKKFSLTMSAWAENFTFAATWQLKHQIAYWKARAQALEYENTVLHDIIRRKNFEGDFKDSTSNVDLDEEENEDSDNSTDDDIDEQFEVSEEYIQFLQENAKYKEDARRERERLKAKDKEDDITETLEAGPSETTENYEDTMKNLYGDKWQRISALEMSLQSDFIAECDNKNSCFWPNIPFNFSHLHS